MLPGTFYRRRCALALVAALAGCGGAPTGGAAVTPANAAPHTTPMTQNVPDDGALQFALVPSLGFSGTIAFPVVPGQPATATLVASTEPPDGLPALAGPPYEPQPVEYLCISFSAHQIPVSPPFVTLSAQGTPAPAPSGVGLAYYAPYSKVWDQRYGRAAFASSVRFAAGDAVYYAADRTCFALYVTFATPFPA
jgi:hypothetical protein